jgi:hypothetical protein
MSPDVVARLSKSVSVNRIAGFCSDASPLGEWTDNVADNVARLSKSVSVNRIARPCSDTSPLGEWTDDVARLSKSVSANRVARFCSDTSPLGEWTDDVARQCRPTFQVGKRERLSPPRRYRQETLPTGDATDKPSRFQILPLAAESLIQELHHNAAIDSF